VFPVRYGLNSYTRILFGSVFVFRMVLTINSINRLGFVARRNVFPVRYGLYSYIRILFGSVFVCSIWFSQ
jgi:hypothetical protein